MPDELEGLPPAVRALLEEAIKRMRVEQTDPVLSSLAELHRDVRETRGEIRGLSDGFHAVDRRVAVLEAWQNATDLRIEAVAAEGRARTDEVDRRHHSTLDGVKVELRALEAKIDTVTRARAHAAEEWAKVCRLVTENWKGMLGAAVLTVVLVAIVWRVPLRYSDGTRTVTVGEATEANEAAAGGEPTP